MDFISTIFYAQPFPPNSYGREVSVMWIFGVKKVKESDCRAGAHPPAILRKA